MRYILVSILSLSLIISASPSQAGFLDDLTRQAAPLLQGGMGSSLDDSTIIKGLKEALATGTERAVNEVAKPDGYFGNSLIKIMLPDKIQKVADLLGTVGYQRQVDEFVLSMNRAAEKAAPQAAHFFGDAIRDMSVEDARGLLNGGDRAATDFFEKKTRGKLYDAFKPTVGKTMGEVGTVKAFQDMVGKYQALPLAAFGGKPSLDLNDYVTNKALDGLFTMVAAEEKKIRTNPAARTTDLLKTVFGQ
ncbi:hypothetical protein GeomeDRAFT_3092 [Geobacter metallireducens RCH3]|uniref:DUF4197 domain-containing protein n=1 Tax=Geobacter metallireducens (strain ATCC 53774 / DSM 7210 / GS-15) TaxID=269799 RepID=Q39RC8_GEOMG|nr:DUF4197 domain-containing protein [Geobacter metallireducens]ABB33196.1 hypothetical protein Gmet_2981 [Geobacter metallireducens GS-15]EHP84409.1 hypothetical protein GeomeDRAFT_3092 [Geobacter metallireducens RCH3]